MLEDRFPAAASEETVRAPLGATPVLAAEELDPGRERRPL